MNNVITPHYDEVSRQPILSVLDLPNNVNANLSSIDPSCPLQMAITTKALKQIIGEEAKAHKTGVDTKSCQYVMEAIQSKTIKAHIVTVEYDDTRSEIAGAAITIPTVYSTWDPRLNNFLNRVGIYIEDTFLFQRSSKEFRARTISASNPNGIGLGTFLKCEIIRQSALNSKHTPFGLLAGGYIAEHGANNEAIKTIYKKLNARLEHDPANFVMHLSNTTDLPPSNKKIEPKILATKDHMGLIYLYPHIFALNWSSGNDAKRIQATFTNSISTFEGAPIVRIQITSNKVMPGKKALANIMSSMMKAGADLVKHKWITDSDNVLPNFRIHAAGEPEITKALKEIGAKDRVLGNCPMRPVEIDFRDLHGILFNKLPPKASEFFLHALNK